MPSYLTSAGLIAGVERGACIPSNQSTFLPEDYLAFANEEMKIGVIPSVLIHHQEHYVRDSEKIKLVSHKSNYQIPSRSIAGRIRDVLWSDDNGNLRPLSRISPEDRPHYQRTSTTNVASYYYIQGNDIVLAPVVGANPTGFLIISYYLRPNSLVQMSRSAWINDIQREPSKSGVISSISTGAPALCVSANHNLRDNDVILVSGSNSSPSIDGYHSVTIVDANTFSIELNTQIDVAGNFAVYQFDTITFELDKIPANFTTKMLCDILQTEGGHKTYSMDVRPLRIDIENRKITFFSPDLSPEIKIGDYVMQAGECVIPQCPDELHDVLVHRVVGRCLQAQGDQEGFNNANARVAEMEAKTATLISNRSEGDPIKVVNRNNLIRASKFWRRGF